VIIVFGSYITAYSFRIYIMNYYKNTRKQESDKDNNKAFFAIEQISSTLALILITLGVVACVTVCGASGPRVTPFANAVTSPDMEWAPWAYLAGIGYGIVAFFSVFLFMFKGRTATFAGLVNRLTSLIAGTTATLLFAFAFTGDYPEIIDWISLIFIFAAVGFMGKAEKKRRREMSEAEGHQKPKEETSF
jgi:drug/metabolite transporter (DMT)-like permease